MDENASATIASAEQAHGRHGLFGIARDLTFAGIGLVGVLSEEVHDLYHRSVERGQHNVQGVREHLRFRRGRQADPVQPHEKRRRRSSTSPEEWRATLSRLNVASPDDINALSRQVAELEARIDQLAAAQSGESAG